VPFNLTSAANHFLHPQPHARGKAHAKWYQTLESAAKHLADHDRCHEYANAEKASALLQSCEGRLVADGRCRVEQDIGFLAMNRDIRCCSFGDWVRWRGDVLVVFVVFERLMRVCLNGLLFVSMKFP
jgi:hypothetical protein